VNFLAPAFAALTLLGVLPVLIHLHGRRRAKVRPLPTLLILLASHRRVAQRTKLRHLLLLLFRVLVLVAIPLCLAKPFIETASDLPAQVSAAQSAVLLIDDSLSMNYRLSGIEGGPRLGGGGTPLDRAKKRAAQLVEALPPGAEAALVLGSRGAAAPVPELTGDRARLFSSISAVQPSYRAADLHAALKRAAQILQTVRRSQRRIYLITDAAAHAIDATLQPPADTEVAVLDVTEGKPLPNRAIVETHSDPAPSLGSRAVRITAEVANYADMPVKELPMTLLVDGKPVAKGLVDLPARGHAVKRFVHILQPPPSEELAPAATTPAAPGADSAPGATASGQTGLHHLSVALQGDALAEDDERHLRVEVQRHLRVLILDGDSRTLRRDDEAFYLEMALRPGDRDDAPFAVITQPLDEADAALADFDAVFLCNAKAADVGRRGLDKALRQYVQGGGGLFITLGDNTEVDAYNTTLRELLPQALAVVKTTGPLQHAGQADAPGAGEGESAVTGPGEHLGLIDRRHPLLLPFSSGRATESLLSASFGRYMLLRPTLRATGDSGGVILSYESGAPALIERQLGRGRVLLFTSTIDRDWNNLPIQPAFLPLVQQTVRYLSHAPLRDSEPATLIGQARDIRLQAGDTRVEISLPSGKKRLFERLGGRQVLTFTDTIEPGFYRVAAAGDGGVLRPRPAEFFVVNIDPSESDLQKAPPARLLALQRPLKDADAADQGGAPKRQVELWHYLGALLLLLLVGEALLLRQK
jgi:hypothetical protein